MEFQSSAPPREQRLLVSDATGYRLEMEKISFNQIDLKWASYQNPEEKWLSFCPEQPMIVSHFRLSDPQSVFTSRDQQLREKQFVVYRENAQPYELQVSATKDQSRSFFELNMSDHFLITCSPVKAIS